MTQEMMNKILHHLEEAIGLLRTAHDLEPDNDWDGAAETVQNLIDTFDREGW
jgi:hypothetical protein